jgi:lipoate---protein ligase
MIRIIDTGLLSGAENMAWDEALLTARARAVIPDTLRYLRFAPPVALVGYHQSVEEEIRLDYCREQGIDINRRITGGGAIYFDEGQLGWELIINRKTLFPGFTLTAITEAVGRAAALGLSLLGLEAAFRPRNDIEIQGRKISGTGAASEGAALLFQGTLLIDFNLEHLIKALRIPTEKLNRRELSSSRERVTSLREQLGRLPSLEEVKTALEKGLEQGLGLRFRAGLITDEERELFRLSLPGKQSSKWIQGSRLPFRPHEVLRSIHKEEGGLVRTSIKVDLKKNRIKDLLITGDFFIQPRRAIYDLEAALKGLPISDLDRQVEDYFHHFGGEISGLGWGDFLQGLHLALEKLAYPEKGFSLDEADQMTVFNGTLQEILEGCDLLLLPYCAKLPDCEYRQQQGCSQCGLCTIGEAYTLAEDRGLKVLTIQNYEHLVETLEEEKRQGVRAYIGCCCDAFQLKRQEAFKGAGLPGLLLDIENTTCYELNQEKEAYQGNFENQTHLRIELLKKVLQMAGPRNGG